MITLEKSGKIMKVETELQASAFIANGYKRVDKAPEQKFTPQNDPFKRDEKKADTDPFAQFMNAPEAAEPDSPAEAPKRRRRRKAE